MSQFDGHRKTAELCSARTSALRTRNRASLNALISSNLWIVFEKFLSLISSTLLTFHFFRFFASNRFLSWCAYIKAAVSSTPTTPESWSSSYGRIASCLTPMKPSLFWKHSLSPRLSNWLRGNSMYSFRNFRKLESSTRIPVLWSPNGFRGCAKWQLRPQATEPF